MPQIAKLRYVPKGVSKERPDVYRFVGSKEGLNDFSSLGSQPIQSCSHKHVFKPLFAAASLRWPDESRGPDKRAGAGQGYDHENAYNLILLPGHKNTKGIDLAGGGQSHGVARVPASARLM